MQDAFTAPGRFFRGNIHTHSTLSDGALEPGEVCRLYREAGYDFLALTEHFIGFYKYPIANTRPFRAPGFTTLMGAELHAGRQDSGDLWHILAVGLPEDFAAPDAPHFWPVAGAEEAAAIAARARAAGAFVAVAHPQWSGLTLNDAMAIEAAHAVEIYNHGCEVVAARGDGLAMADQMLSAGRRVNAIATDDAHLATDDYFGGWVMVKAEENAPEALLAALKAGMNYSTQGPEIRRIDADGKWVEVECSPCETVIIQGHGQSANAVHGLSMTRARVEMNHWFRSPWLRVTVVDRAGRKAWSNPYWL
ncbi:MAG: CehA/McbA family metallohydrolase [Albidovulum sp.]|uniref:PHP domain-containing protein n=1 Tax=Albidovulum sp. TaxID=1872424 RepID=UPI003CB41C34